MVSGHWWGTERHTVCLSLAGGPVSLFFKLLSVSRCGQPTLPTPTAETAVSWQRGW